MPPMRTRLPSGSLRRPELSATMRSSTIITRGRGRGVLLVEQPAAAQRDLHRAEVVGGGDALIDVDEPLVGGRGPPFDRDRSPRHHVAERQRRDAAGGGDAGQPGEPAPRARGTRSPPWAVSGYLRPVSVMPIVSTRSGLNPVGTRWSSAKLRTSSPAPTSSMTASVSSAIDEQLPRPLPPSPRRQAGGLAVAVLQLDLQIEPRRAQRRRQAEDHGRQQRDRRS